MLSIVCALLMASLTVVGSDSSTLSRMDGFNPLMYLSNFSASLMSSMSRHTVRNSSLYFCTEWVCFNPASLFLAIFLLLTGLNAVNNPSWNICHVMASALLLGCWDTRCIHQ